MSRISQQAIYGVIVPENLRLMATLYKDNPYSVPHEQYINIQNELLELMNLLNDFLPEDCRLQARIELNCILWA